MEETKGVQYIHVGDVIGKDKNIGTFILDGKTYHIWNWNPDITYEIEVTLKIKDGN